MRLGLFAAISRDAGGAEIEDGLSEGESADGDGIGVAE